MFAKTLERNALKLSSIDRSMSADVAFRSHVDKYRKYEHNLYLIFRNGLITIFDFRSNYETFIIEQRVHCAIRGNRMRL